MIGFLLFNTYVQLQADTLKFIKGESIVDVWLLGQKITAESIEIHYTKKAKVSSDNKYFLLYDEEYYPQQDSVWTKITLYNSGRKRVWERCHSGNRKINFDLTNLYKSVIVLVTTDKFHTQPELEIIKNKKSEKIIKENSWTRITNYGLSPNLRYLVLHTRNPYQSKLWDYIYAIDLKTKKDWEYLFPVCLSCKRGNISVSVDNEGTVEAVFKNEHRIFSKDGQLVDIFIKLD